MEIRSFRYSARKSRKKRVGKRLVSIALTAILLLSSAGYSYAALTKPLPVLSVSVPSLQPVAAEAVPLPWPSNGAAAIGSSVQGLLAYSEGAETPRPIASTAKLITALALMKQKPFAIGTPGPTLTLDTTDVGYYNAYVAKSGSVAPVAAGEQISQYQAMQTMLLPSANNMADSLARWAFGSAEAYIAYANTMVKDLGLTHTTITDASGFSPGTMSTPKDLIIVSQQALAQPVIKEIVAQKEASVPAAGIIQNTNQLLPDKASGIKTGHTNEAGWCLLFARDITSASGQKNTVIGVVLGASSSSALYTTAQNLLTAAAAGFSTREIIKKDQVIGSYNSAWGMSGNIVADESVPIYGWKDTELTPQAHVMLNTTTVNVGQDVGTVGLADTQVHLQTNTKVSPPGIWWRLTHYF